MARARKWTGSLRAWVRILCEPGPRYPSARPRTHRTSQNRFASIVANAFDDEHFVGFHKVGKHIEARFDAPEYAKRAIEV